MVQDYSDSLSFESEFVAREFRSAIKIISRSRIEYQAVMSIFIG
jgi:hypothetical protein